ncbi:MAG: hypothetical protein HC884_18060 [Chloroflexaceae bacterium]|nr:hypothetical protein [Chloroflexaceae bacterium]
MMGDEEPMMGDEEPMMGDEEPMMGDLFANMQTYTFDTGLFQIDIPQGWELHEQDNVSDRVTEMWGTEASGNPVMVSVIIVEPPAELSNDEVTQLTVDGVTGAFGENPGFETYESEEQTDGSFLIPFVFEQDGTLMRGNAYGEQRGNKFSMLMMVAAEESFSDYWDAGLSTIANSYSIDPTASLSME